MIPGLDEYSGIRTFRVLRALRTISAVKGKISFTRLFLYCLTIIIIYKIEATSGCKLDQYFECCASSLKVPLPKGEKLSLVLVYLFSGTGC